MSVAANEAAIGGALTAFLTALAAIGPEIEATIASSGKNPALDVGTAADLLGALGASLSHVGGVVGTVATETASLAPIAKQVGSVVAATIVAGLPGAAPAPAAS